MWKPVTQELCFQAFFVLLRDSNKFNVHYEQSETSENLSPKNCVSKFFLCFWENQISLISIMNRVEQRGNKWKPVIQELFRDSNKFNFRYEQSETCQNL